MCGCGKNHPEMMILHGHVYLNGKEKPMALMVDTGCTMSCISDTAAKQLQVPLRRLARPKYASMADGSTHEIKYETILDICIGKYRVKWKFEVGAGTLEPQDMLLGMDWLQKLNPQISFRPLALKVNGPNGRSYELIGSPTRDWCGTHGYGHTRGRAGGYGGAGAGGMRTGYGTPFGHGGYGHGLPFGIQGIPVFQSVEVGACSPARCDEGNKKDTKDKASLKEETRWVNWKDIFPEMTWLPSTPNEQDDTTKQKVEIDAKHEGKKPSDKQVQREVGAAGRAPQAQSTATKVANTKGEGKTKGIVLAAKSKNERGRYDLFR